MSQAYNYISFVGNKQLGNMLLEIERRFNEFKVTNPTSFNRDFIGEILYGLRQAEFKAASNISDVTKNLRISYFSPSESEFESGSLIPTDFQDYLTVALSKIDSHVVVINSFNTTHDEYGYYISLCEDATNGNYNILSVYDSLEDSNGSGKGISSMYKKLIHQLHKQAPWAKKVLKV